MYKTFFSTRKLNKSKKLGARVFLFLFLFRYFFCMKEKYIQKWNKMLPFKKDSWYFFSIFKNHRYRKFHSGLSNIVLNSSLVVVVGKQELCVFFSVSAKSSALSIAHMGKIKINEIWDRSNTQKKKKMIVHFFTQTYPIFFFFNYWKAKITN